MGKMRGSLILLCAFALQSPANATDYDARWEEFADDMAWDDSPDMDLLTNNYQMDIGMIQTAYWTLAWREGSEVGVYLRYVYAQPVSPSELPGPGPMTAEEVEMTIDCANRSTRLHNMYLYRADGSTIGRWYDPALANNPSSFGTDSMAGLAYAKVC